MDTLRFVGTSYILGLLTPLTALCVIPLYPAFLARMARLASHDRNDRAVLAWTGLVVTAGVISFMALLGIVFTTLLQESLQQVIGIVSPIAFAILAVVGIMMMAGVEIDTRSACRSPRTRSWQATCTASSLARSSSPATRHSSLRSWPGPP